MSIPSIIKAFNETLGMPPKQFITQFKIERAVVLLLERSKSVSSIAEELGVQDPYQFSKLFKKNKGLSPKEYRIGTTVRDNGLSK